MEGKHKQKASFFKSSFAISFRNSYLYLTSFESHIFSSICSLINEGVARVNQADDVKKKDFHNVLYTLFFAYRCKLRNLA
jgi:hypothetical protein